MSDAVTRLNAALEGLYEIERELGEGGMATVYLSLPQHQSPQRAYSPPGAKGGKALLFGVNRSGVRSGGGRAPLPAGGLR